ncbi:MAG: cbb3-type cytochrome c oxidase N-terminal domain-containing protein [Saprospiraceae bacterium]|nr:cbb3-type cytochrome c oxidase N-terminal domain-containing protein [Saprospiraceae bacterium]
MKTILNHKYITTLALVVMPFLLMAQSKAKSNTYLDWAYDNIFLVLGVIVFIGVGFTLWNAMNGIVEHQKREFLREQGVEITPVKEVKKPSIFKELYDKAWSLVPIDREADIDLGHDYDGIRELDNRLPPWWVYTFYLTIFIGVGYLYVYHGSDIGLSQIEEYELAMEEGEAAKEAFAARQTNSIDEKNLVAITDAKGLEKAHGIYIANCAACHGAEGQGGVGPNMTDNYWVHGGSLSDVYQTIKNGVPEKGMIAWKAQMQPATILSLASYIKTLQGTNPPNQKAQEGELYEEVLTATTPE